MPRSQQAAIGLLQVFVQGLHLGQRLVPPAGVEEQLAQGAVRLRQPDHRAGLVGEVPGLPGRGEGLVVPVEVAQRDGLVDLQQQPQVGQRRVGLGHGQRPVEQRQRVGHLRPALAVTRVSTCSAQPIAQLSPASDGHRKRGRGDLAGLLDLAEVAVRPRREHEQPGAVPGRDPRRGQRPVQRGQGLREPARPHPALRQRPVQVDRARSGSTACASARLATCSAAAASPTR